MRTSQEARAAYLAHAIIWRDPGTLSPTDLLEGPVGALPFTFERATSDEGIFRAAQVDQFAPRDAHGSPDRGDVIDASVAALQDKVRQIEAHRCEPAAQRSLDARSIGDGAVNPPDML
jgi:hypothetical protein